MWRTGLALAMAAALSACATLPTGAPQAGAAVAAIPSTPINIGDWRRTPVAGVARAFENEIGARYRAGQAYQAVSADLRRNDFACVPNRDTAGRGDPPDQICRRTASSDGCTHTWQVHLYQSGETLERARPLYDRHCSSDALLGGPG